MLAVHPVTLHVQYWPPIQCMIATHARHEHEVRRTNMHFGMWGVSVEEGCATRGKTEKDREIIDVGTGLEINGVKGAAASSMENVKHKRCQVLGHKFPGWKQAAKDMGLPFPPVFADNTFRTMSALDKDGMDKIVGGYLAQKKSKNNP